MGKELVRGDLVVVENTDGKEVSLVFVDSLHIGNEWVGLLYHPENSSTLVFNYRLYQNLDEGMMLGVSPLHNTLILESSHIKRIVSKSDYKLSIDFKGDK